MRMMKAPIVAGCCLLSAVAVAQTPNAKAGLWEVTSNMTWQQSPFPQGMPAGGNSPFGGGPRNTAVCITQEQIDKFGSPPPETRRDCQLSNIVKTATGMTADMVCTGAMSGKGTVVSSWTDSEHSTSKIHFTGSMQMGPAPKPVEWTIDVTSLFKTSDCGAVKPVSPPGN
jgi:hypothetical protein